MLVIYAETSAYTLHIVRSTESKNTQFVWHLHFQEISVE